MLSNLMLNKKVEHKNAARGKNDICTLTSTTKMTNKWKKINPMTNREVGIFYG
jgi:hypothetical protein